jgi:two-component system chemotaxis response regulator CheB
MLSFSEQGSVMKKISVIVVDDSALVRKLLTEILNSDPDIEVVATAADPFQAREKIKQFNPDVLTLDVEMPRMDGVTFLRNLMRLRPMPVVMISTMTENGAEVTLEALELGAFDYVEKPKIDLSHSFADYAEVIISKVKAAAGAKVRTLENRQAMKVEQRLTADAVLAKQAPRTTRLVTTEKNCCDWCFNRRYRGHQRSLMRDAGLSTRYRHHSAYPCRL